MRLPRAYQGCRAENRVEAHQGAQGLEGSHQAPPGKVRSPQFFLPLTPAEVHPRAAEKEAAAQPESESEDEPAPTSDIEKPDDENEDEDAPPKPKPKKKAKGKGKGKGKGGVVVPEEWPWEEAKQIFLKPDVLPADEVEVCITLHPVPP